MFWNRSKKVENTLTYDKVRNLIEKLQLPQIIMELFDEDCCNEKVFSLLGTQYQKPHNFFVQPISQTINNYKVDRYVPFLAIWQSIILAYDTVGRGFVRYSLEHFYEDDLILLTWDGLMLKEVISWWESEWSNDDIIYIGNLFGINNIEKLIQEISLNNTEGQSYNERINWENDLLYRIGGIV